MLSRREFLNTTAVVPGAALAASPATGAVELRCEYADDPLGIDARAPRLSWQVASGMQSAYQIVVSSDGRALWDSGKVSSSQSMQVPYAGQPLTSRLRCTWKVRVWDGGGAASDWSAPAHFEMGLLDPVDWRAKWVGAPGSGNDSSPRTSASPFFRQRFRVEARPRIARAYICGLGFYELHINGRKVSEDVLSPNQTDYDHRRLQKLLYPFEDHTEKHALYLTYDVASYLREGENVAGVVLGDGWYNQRDRIEEGVLWYGAPRMLVQIEGERGELLSASGEDWRVTTAGPILQNGIFIGENYDARLAMPGWDAPGFDDSAWDAAASAPPPKGQLRAQVSPPDRVVATLPPVAGPVAASGVYSFDAGGNVSGWARLRVRGERGRKVTMRFSEEQGPDYGQADSYVLNGEGVETWEPRFTWHGFRHVDVSGAAAPPEMDIRVVHSAVERVGRFECSNPLFGRIHETFVRTQLSNMHCGVTSDCPHRERLGYTGDGHVAAQSAVYALDMARFYNKWTQDIADARNHESGYVPHTAPFEGGGGGPPWGSAMVLMPWYLYLYYADRRALELHYDAMTGWVRYLGTRTDSRGIVVKEEPGGWFLGDWCAPAKIEIPPEFVSTCYYAHCARMVARVARILGRAGDAAAFDALAGRTGGAMHQHFFDVPRRQYANGRQGANFFPLAFGLVPPGQQDAVFARAVEILTKDNREHFDTGFVGTPLVLDVLTARGRADLAYRLMNQSDFPSFGHMLKQGATTLWESWDGRGSHAHPMFGGACRWFWQALAGIHPDPRRPGFEHTIVRPQVVEDLRWVRAEYRCQRGTLKVNWSREGGSFHMDLTVPPNSEATVYLPGGKAAAKAGPGQHEFSAAIG
jgi:alpha-L-rhamnosidase